MPPRRKTKRFPNRPIGLVCRSARILAGLTQFELAKLVGTQFNTISRIELGENVRGALIETVLAALQAEGIKIIYKATLPIGVCYRDLTRGRYAYRRNANRHRREPVKQATGPRKPKPAESGQADVPQPTGHA